MEQRALYDLLLEAGADWRLRDELGVTPLLAASIGVWLFYVQHQFEETFWAENSGWSRHEAALHARIPLVEFLERVGVLPGADEDVLRLAAGDQRDRWPDLLLLLGDLEQEAVGHVSTFWLTRTSSERSRASTR